MDPFEANSRGLMPVDRRQCLRLDAGKVRGLTILNECWGGLPTMQ
jgi:hypothetical protein